MPAFLLLSAAPALAHPHVFIDTRIEVIQNDQNEAAALRIGWTRDDLHSLLEGQLTAAEEASLSGFDMRWIEGSEGDTYVPMDITPIDISGLRDWAASYADGRLSSTHVRGLLTPVPVAEVPLVIQACDPGYYIHHAILPPAVVTGGTGCAAQVFARDVGAADAALQEALKEYAPEDLEGQFPAVGAKFSDEVRVICAAP